ncbi:MAG: sulfide/dihydroorotate dehydrogenase-like FAD/NAD-binding protein [Oscillospiraceae bacterium]|nr:sulfide/dihydroorotate dehydrogenase-like FAD/NAD-binding protein [Oscillospiraceae bacterium]
MFEVLNREKLNENTYYYKISAPLIAKKVMPGQFMLIRAYEKGERIPLTVADYDREAGTVSVIFQAVGRSTQKLAEIEQGQSLTDVLGPLGKPTHYGDCKKVAVVGGGLGIAIAYPQAKYLHSQGVSVDIIAGFRNKDLIILENEMKNCSDNLFIATDDGSNGRKGLVTDVLRQQIENGVKYDLVIAIGPPIMMKFTSLLTKEFGIRTIVSLNPIMVDGTGMCGGCRVVVGGETKFACIDGPDFDGHLVDYDNLMKRLRIYDANHKCNIGLGE